MTTRYFNHIAALTNINVILVVIGLQVIDDVRMVKHRQDSNLFHDALETVIPDDRLLINDLDCDLNSWVLNIVALKHFSEGARAEQFTLGGN